MTQTTHHGGCHCGAVRFQVDIDLGQPAITCNCSICSRGGTMLSFVPATQFKLERGDADLADYQFNRNIVHHRFCKTCGIKPFGHGNFQGVETVAVNVRCIDNVDLEAVPTMPYDGKSL